MAGVASGGVAVLTDVSARRRAEEEVRTLNLSLEERVQARTTELERNRNALQAIIENVPAAVYVKDLDGRYCATTRAWRVSSAMPGNRWSAGPTAT
jgi:PAS domain-containing protein